MPHYMIQFDVKNESEVGRPDGVYNTGKGEETTLARADKYATRELAESVKHNLYGGTVIEAHPSPRELFLEFLEDPPEFGR